MAYVYCDMDKYGKDFLLVMHSLLTEKIDRTWVEKWKPCESKKKSDKKKKMLGAGFSVITGLSSFFLGAHLMYVVVTQFKLRALSSDPDRSCLGC